MATDKASAGNTFKIGRAVSAAAVSAGAVSAAPVSAARAAAMEQLSAAAINAAKLVLRRTFMFVLLEVESTLRLFRIGRARLLPSRAFGGEPRMTRIRDGEAPAEP